MTIYVKALHAIIHGLIDSDVKTATGVPGFPTTGLMEAIAGNIPHEWSINEKVALEIALGSSVCGERSVVITKHVGMNILADPLVTSATHTIGAGVVIIAGDDPGVQKSQNEQDSRNYGLIAEVPVFDPATPDAAYRCIKDAYILSEKAMAPVIMRVTDRLLGSEGGISRNSGTTAAGSLDKEMWLLTMRGKHQRFHKDSYPRMCEYAESSKLNIRKTNGNRTGVISSGFPSVLVDSILPQDVSHLSLTVVNPLPVELIEKFLNDHERVLVVEETEPVIEKQLFRKVPGKLTGHLPYGLIEKADIEKALRNIEKDNVDIKIKPQTIEERGNRPICPDCPYLPLYMAIKELDVPVAGDLGCSVLTSSPPLSLLDAAFSLGSSISTACGFIRKGIAIIGDFGLAHSGICGLINAVHNQHDLVVIVLQNDVAAMTGGQAAPDLTGLIEYYIKDTITIDPHALDLKEMLLDKLKKKGISVVLAKARCPRYYNS